MKEQKRFYDAAGRRYPADDNGQKIYRSRRPEHILQHEWSGPKSTMTAAQRDDAATDYKRGSKSKSKSSTAAAAACAIDEENDPLWEKIGGSIDQTNQSLEEISLKAAHPGAPSVPHRDKRGKKKKSVLNSHLLLRVPCKTPDGKHRPKIQDGVLIPACVARPVSKSEPCSTIWMVP